MKRLVSAASVAAVLVMTLVGCSDKGHQATRTLSPAGERGRTVARDQGCVACHSPDGGHSVGPTWQGLAGSKVRTADGRSLIADDAYLTRSIERPGADVVAGYADLMPKTYRLTRPQIADLLAYLHDLSSH